MLTSISPLGERARHNRWAITVSWYSAASVVAAAAVGAILGWVGGLVGLPVVSRVGLLAAFSAVAAVADATGARLPGPRRQVNEDWLARYRGWVYGAGFGAQLGAGVATIVTTATVWLCLGSEVLSGSAAAGALIGSVFGAFRALPLLGEARVRSYASLQARHRALAGRGPAAATTTVAAAGAAAVGLGVLAAVGAS